MLFVIECIFSMIRCESYISPILDGNFGREFYFRFTGFIWRQMHYLVQINKNQPSELFTTFIHNQQGFKGNIKSSYCPPDSNQIYKTGNFRCKF